MFEGLGLRGGRAWVLVLKEEGEGHQQRPGQERRGLVWSAEKRSVQRARNEAMKHCEYRAEGSDVEISFFAPRLSLTQTVLKPQMDFPLRESLRRQGTRKTLLTLTQTPS